jgi:hypothetical protein
MGERSLYLQRGTFHGNRADNETDAVNGCIADFADDGTDGVPPVEEAAHHPFNPLSIR